MAQQSEDAGETRPLTSHALERLSTSSSGGVLEQAAEEEGATLEADGAAESAPPPAGSEATAAVAQQGEEEQRQQQQPQTNEEELKLMGDDNKDEKEEPPAGAAPDEPHVESVTDGRADADAARQQQQQPSDGDDAPVAVPSLPLETDAAGKGGEDEETNAAPVAAAENGNDGDDGGQPPAAAAAAVAGADASPPPSHRHRSERKAALERLTMPTSMRVLQRLEAELGGGDWRVAGGGAASSVKCLSSAEMAAMVDRLSAPAASKGDGGGEAKPARQKALKLVYEGGKEAFVPVKTSTSAENVEYLAQLYERCRESRDRTRAALDEKYLKPLTAATPPARAAAAAPARKAAGGARKAKAAPAEGGGEAADAAPAAAE